MSGTKKISVNALSELWKVSVARNVIRDYKCAGHFDSGVKVFAIYSLVAPCPALNDIWISLHIAPKSIQGYARTTVKVFIELMSSSLSQ